MIYERGCEACPSVHPNSGACHSKHEEQKHRRGEARCWRRMDNIRNKREIALWGIQNGAQCVWTLSRLRSKTGQATKGFWVLVCLCELFHHNWNLEDQWDIALCYFPAKPKLVVKRRKWSYVAILKVTSQSPLQKMEVWCLPENRENIVTGYEFTFQLTAWGSKK